MTYYETHGHSSSVWMETAGMGYSCALPEDAHADVCIVGAGIAGMTTAYLLARQSMSVIVLDDGAIGGGMTQRTTAHLSNALDDRYSEIERLHGPLGAHLAAESHTAAIDRIESIIRAEHIDCDFMRLDGYLFLGPGQGPDLLEQEIASAYRAGLRDIERLPRAPVASFDTGPCLKFPRQGQFHPLKYLRGLLQGIQREGGRVYTRTHVISVKGGKTAVVRTDNGRTVTADAAVVATNTPVNDRVAIHTKQAPYMTYVIGALIPRGSVTPALYWDMQDPYHYVRLQPFTPGMPLDRDVLIIGGEDHKTGQMATPADAYVRLETWARQRYPMITGVHYRWSGEVMETMDGLAFIGKNPMDEPNIFVVTGDSGMGMTHGTIAGMLLTDLIFGRENRWATLYDPSRKTLRAIGKFMKENLNVGKQYGKWLTGGDVASEDDIKPGTGAVLRRGLSKIAAYRDEQGGMHEFSASCTHLGCVVNWNSAEHTWDCPCHGSRFDQLGGVIQGPANRDLDPAAEEGSGNLTEKQAGDVGI